MLVAFLKSCAWSSHDGIFWKRAAKALARSTIPAPMGQRILWHPWNAALEGIKYNVQTCLHLFRQWVCTLHFLSPARTDWGGMFTDSRSFHCKPLRYPIAAAALKGEKTLGPHDPRASPEKGSNFSGTPPPTEWDANFAAVATIVHYWRAKSTFTFSPGNHLLSTIIAILSQPVLLLSG